MDKEMTPFILFDAIIKMVVTGRLAPYYKMMGKAKDIDIDYFDKINRGVNSLSDELNLELKDKVVESFSKMADSYYLSSDLESRIVAMIQEESDTIKENNGKNKYQDFLNALADKLETYVKDSNIHEGFPKYTNDDIEAMYKDAKRITIKEFLLGSNGEDVLAFYSALMDNTWWACREVVVRKTNSFLLSLAIRARKMINNELDTISN